MKKAQKKREDKPEDMKKTDQLASVVVQYSEEIKLNFAESEIVSRYCFHKIFLNAFSIIYNNYMNKFIMKEFITYKCFKMIEESFAEEFIMNDTDELCVSQESFNDPKFNIFEYMSYPVSHF